MINCIKQIVKRISRICVLIAIVLIVPLVGHRGHKHYLYDYKGKAIVRLTGTGMGYKSGGTGFQVYSPNGNQYTATNYHVCMLSKKAKGTSDYFLNAEDYNGKNHKIKVLHYSYEHDLCLLEPVYNLPVLRLAYKYYLHEQIHLIGHPRLANLTMQTGSIVSKGYIDIALPTRSNHTCKTFNRILYPAQKLKRLLYFMPVGFKVCRERLLSLHANVISYGGNSGSPVLDDFGNVIGVLYAGVRTQLTNTYIVPLEYLARFLSNK